MVNYKRMTLVSDKSNRMANPINKITIVLKLMSLILYSNIYIGGNKNNQHYSYHISNQLNHSVSKVGEYRLKCQSKSQRYMQ
ncbi:MAG: hypothetical protein AABY14_04810 [Nanoarchaeota archaeon]